MRLTIVDAFTAAPFAGNPAAVCVLERFPAESVMQAVAAEMNLSETAFCVPGSEPGDHELRWFTPVAEVDLCGHATLATAHVLSRPARFSTRSGWLTATPTADGWIELDFPADPPAPVDDADVDRLVAVLGGPTPVAVLAGRDDWLIELAHASAVRALEPDVNAVAALGRRGMIVTAAGDGGAVDVVSRCFYPAYGIAEDPVTGSAHCALAPYWSERLGRDELVCEQASRRGGIVRTRLAGDRVVLAGQAVTVARTELVIAPEA